MSLDALRIKVGVVHEYGRWRAIVGDRQQDDITPAQAIRFARACDKLLGEARYVPAVQERIREIAVEAEGDAERLTERAAEQTASNARSAYEAHHRALARRREATELAPADE